MLEFHVPRSPVARAGWWIYTRVLMRVLGTAASPAWARTVAFLGPNISRFVGAIRWRSGWAGSSERASEHVRTRTFLFGSAVVLWGVKDG